MIYNDGYIKMIDFGNSFIGKSSEFFGTLEYISPEVLK